MNLKKEKNKLSRLTIEEKALVYCKLNNWKCPKPFKYLKDILPNVNDEYYPNNMRTLLMDEIKIDIGKYECSKRWWEYQKLGSATDHKIWWGVEGVLWN